MLISIARFGLLSCCSPVALLSFLGSFACGAAQLFVAPNGSDRNPGSETHPFASLERARDEIRKLKTRSGPAETNFQVLLRGGDYYRTNAFLLDKGDSGTVHQPIQWQAYKAERVRLLGGVALPVKRFGPVRQAGVSSRLPPGAQENVVEIRLGNLGLHPRLEMRSRGFSRPTTIGHCELFQNGRPLTLARWPNEGQFDHISGFPTNNAQGDSHGGSIGKLDGGFYYGDSRPSTWQKSDHIWVHGYWSWDWANSYERVTAFDHATKLVLTADPHGVYGFRKGQRIFFVNVLEELDQPGEWFLDEGSGSLFVWPASKLDGQTEILLSLLPDPLIRMTEVSHVIFRGLTLEATRGNAVEIRGGQANHLIDCVLRNIGNYGLTVEGGQAHGVTRCEILDTGDGGVSLTGGDRQTLTPGRHFVEDCHFARQGRWSKCYVPAVLMTGVGLRASHNLIHDHPHCAVLFNGNDHVVEFNEIHHIALETGDVGAVYSGRDYTWRGNKVRFNYIHHTGGVGMGSMGIYMDDCISGTEIVGNVFFKVQRAVFLGGGRDHEVLNNIFVECNPAISVDGRGLDRAPVWRAMVDEFMRNRMREVPSSLYRERYPEIKSLDRYFGPPQGPPITGDAFVGVPAENNLIDRNLCVGKWLTVDWHANMSALRVGQNVTNAIECFLRSPGLEPTATEFDLKPQCAAWKTGFKKLPLKEIGPREAHLD